MWGWSRWETALASSPSLPLPDFVPWFIRAVGEPFPWEPFPKLPEGLKDPTFEAVLNLQVKKGSEHPLSPCPAPGLSLLPPSTPGCSPGAPTAPFPSKSSHGSPPPSKQEMSNI